MNRNRAERIIAYMVAAAVGLSILSFIAVIIGTATGMSQADFGSGVWPMVVMIPWLGLPLGFILIFTLLLVNLVRRRREAKDAE